MYGDGEPVLKDHHDLGIRMNGHALSDKDIRLG